MSAISAPKVYGKLNIAVNNDGSDGVNEKEIDLVSNASRLGFKGKVDMKNGLTGIYQIEYQVDITNDNTKGKTFDQRNFCWFERKLWYLKDRYSRYTS